MSAKTLDTMRAKIEAKRADIETLAAAPRTVDEAVAIVLAEYDRAAEGLGGGRLADTLAGHNDGVPQFTIGGVYDQEPHAAVQTVLLLIGREHVEKTARRFLTAAAAKQPPGLSVADRRTRTATLKSEVLELEREEERVILQLEGADGFVPRRHDADPKTILAVWRESL